MGSAYYLGSQPTGPEPEREAPPAEFLCHCGRRLVTKGRAYRGAVRTVAECAKHGIRRVLYSLKPRPCHTLRRFDTPPPGDARKFNA